MLESGPRKSTSHGGRTGGRLATRRDEGHFSGSTANLLGPRHRTYLDARLALIVEALANDQPLEPRHHDHALSGEWGDHHDCHVKPDLVLIYQKSGADTLRLVRLGSHAELGL